jgi:hypothetical protein
MAETWTFVASPAVPMPQKECLKKGLQGYKLLNAGNAKLVTNGHEFYALAANMHRHSFALQPVGIP